jgi:hypothetical protein
MKIIQTFLALVALILVISSSLIRHRNNSLAATRTDFSFQDTTKHSKNKSDSTHKKSSTRKHTDSVNKKADSVHKKYPG